MPISPQTRRPPFNGQYGRQQRVHSASKRGHGHDWQTKIRDRLFKEILVKRPDWWICRLCLDRPAHSWTDRYGNVHGLLDHAIPPSRLFPVGSQKYLQLHRDERNLLPVCQRCNSRKQDRLPCELSDEMRANVTAAMEQTGLPWKDLIAMTGRC